MKARRPLPGLMLVALLTPTVHGQCEQQRLIASDGQQLDNFGAKMALEGDDLLVIRAPGWGPGDVRDFQVYYRDPLGSPCGGVANVSNLVEVQCAP